MQLGVVVRLRVCEVVFVYFLCVWPTAFWPYTVGDETMEKMGLGNIETRLQFVNKAEQKKQSWQFSCFGHVNLYFSNENIF